MARLAALSADDERAKDFLLSGTPFPCGQCLPCRINKRRVWTHRLMLEHLVSPDAVFVTLTYAPEFLPVDGSLQKRDAQLWLKRIRKRVEPRRLRYYLCGEYGGQTHRPHYHAIVYGLYQHEAELCSECWGKGLVHVGSVTQHSVQYVAGYVTKKFTKKDDGLQSEFALMSRKPGIGYPALDSVLELMDNLHFVRLLHLENDVPSGLRHGSKFFPFGRYLRNKLRELMDTGGDLDAFYKDVRTNYREATLLGKTLLEKLDDESRQRIRQVEARSRIFNSRNAI